MNPIPLNDESFMQGLAIAHLSSQIARLSSRANTHLRHERWELAVLDCRAVLKLLPRHAKSLERLARALMKLGNLFDARKIVDDLMEESPTGSFDFKELHEEILRLSQEERGEYDTAKMYQDDVLGFRIFHANYVSQAVAMTVEIQRPEIGSYVGCLANRNIEEGELMSASKAFAFVHPNEKSTLDCKIIDLLRDRPMLGRVVNDLHCFGDYSIKQNLDEQRIRDIICCNSFKASTTITFDQAEILQAASEGLLDGPCALVVNSGSEGLWINESRFNHSCTANCAASSIGDHMFVRSTRSIARGEEICICYVSNSSFESTEKTFGSWGSSAEGFRCVCDRCILLRSNKLLADMEQEVEEAHRNVTPALRHIPESRHMTILLSFSPVEARLKHNVVANLEVMQGAALSLQHKNDIALGCFLRASTAHYAGTGGDFGYAILMWRVAGASTR